MLGILDPATEIALVIGLMGGITMLLVVAAIPGGGSRRFSRRLQEVVGPSFPAALCMRHGMAFCRNQPGQESPGGSSGPCCSGVLAATTRASRWSAHERRQTAHRRHRQRTPAVPQVDRLGPGTDPQRRRQRRAAMTPGAAHPRTSRTRPDDAGKVRHPAEPPASR